MAIFIDALLYAGMEACKDMNKIYCPACLEELEICKLGYLSRNYTGYQHKYILEVLYVVPNGYDEICFYQPIQEGYAHERINWRILYRSYYI